MQKGTIHLLILYEQELRQAARLLHECVEAQETDEFPDKAQALIDDATNLVIGFDSSMTHI